MRHVIYRLEKQLTICPLPCHRVTLKCYHFSRLCELFHENEEILVLQDNFCKQWLSETLLIYNKETIGDHSTLKNINKILPGPSNNVCQCSAIKKFHNNPELIIDKETIIHLDNITVRWFSKHQ